MRDYVMEEFFRRRRNNKWLYCFMVGAFFLGIAFLLLGVYVFFSV
jgi:hypothetical protein